MGKSRRFLPVLVLFFLVQRPAVGQQPLHWEATIDGAKAAASQSHRLVLVLFSAPWCTPCHNLENGIRNEPGATTALEANFVPVKINYDYYPNTAKQYGVTRLPTTVILAPSARGEVLAVIPESMPVGQYLSMLNKIVADANRREAGLFTQIQASPPVGSPAMIGPSPAIGPPIGQSPLLGPLPVTGPAAPANPVPPAQVGTPPRPPVMPVQGQAPAAISPPTSGPAAAAGVVVPPSNVPPVNPVVSAPMVTMPPGPGLSGNRPLDPGRPVENIKRAANPPFGLDGFCPVQLVENSRWQPGKKAWGVIHRGRTYLFAGMDERRRFLAAPDHYAPVDSGDDVVLLLEQGRSVSGYREHGLQFGGHVFLFANEGTLEKFLSNPRYYADRALQALRPPTQTAAVR